MVLGAHAVVGGAIGAVMRGHPLLAFVYGFLSHFILDMIPHFDYPIHSGFVDPHAESKSIKWKQVMLDLICIGVDISIGLGVSFLFFGQMGDLSYAWAWGALGAIMPDALQFAYGLWKKSQSKWFRWLSWLQKVHEAVHTPYRFKGKPLQGMIFQILVTLIIVFIFRV